MLRRNCLLKQVIEGKLDGRIEVTGRRERRRKQLLDRSWIGRILCTNCLLKHVIEGKLEGRIEVTGRRERRRKQLLDRSWIGRILCTNCLLKQVIPGKTEGRKDVKERRGSRHQQLLGDLNENGGSWKLKENALGRILGRTGFGRGCRKTDGDIYMYGNRSRNMFKGDQEKQQQIMAQLNKHHFWSLNERKILRNFVIKFDPWKEEGREGIKCSGAYLRRLINDEKEEIKNKRETMSKDRKIQKIQGRGRWGGDRNWIIIM